MREVAEFAALFTPFTLAGRRLRNRITHASITLLAAPMAAMTVTEPLGMLCHQAGLPGYRSANQVQVVA